MDILLLFVFFGISVYVYCVEGYSSDKLTRKSKQAATLNGFLCYEQYNGRDRSTRLTSNNKKVVVVGDNIVEPNTNKVIINVKDLELEKRQDAMKSYCKKKGYDFYPIARHERHMEKTLHSPVYRSFKTGKAFTLSGKPGCWDVRPMHEGSCRWLNDLSDKWLNRRPGETVNIDEAHVKISGVYDFKHDINEEMFSLQRRCRENLLVRKGVM